MELWVRSQDKNRLTRVDDLYIVHDDNNFCDYIGNDMVGDLAKYTKQGRALEVLDEIQKILEPKTIVLKDLNKLNEEEMNQFKNLLSIIPPVNSIQELSTYVYEMPEE